MLRMKGLLYAACTFPCFTLGLAAFDINSKNNVAVYYGQGPNQQPLRTYCADPTIDIIILSFVNVFPAQGNGYPGINFGNQCWAEVYPGPGWAGVNDTSKNQLYMCPNIQRDLNYCRTVSPSKKILLSLGGATSGYQLSGAQNGIKFATQLWALFGPRVEALVSRGLPRPFDYNNIGFSVDGFDLDIEHPSTDGAVGYKALVTELKRLYGTVNGQKFYLTGSPQCLVPDGNMKEMIETVAFDMLFIQFYNTQQCSARRWQLENPQYKVGGPFAWAGFSYGNWTTYLANTPSRNARLLLALPGSAAAANVKSAVSTSGAANLANAYYCRSNFGGVAVWDSTYASTNVALSKNFYQNMKAALNTAAAGIGRCATDGTAKFPITQDSRCGVNLYQGGVVYGTTCYDDQCCSLGGWCGQAFGYCGAGQCQPGYGRCDEEGGG